MARLGLRGYVTPRAFGGYLVPIPMQSLALRDYCTRKKFVYALPGAENIFPHSYLVLEGLLNDLADYDGLVMCSMHMLPQRAERRQEIYRRVLEPGCQLHFVIEDFAIASPQDAARAEELIVISQVASRAEMPASLD